MQFDWSVFSAAFGLSLGLLVAIGPQNAFILKHGIARRHIGTIVAVCIACDIVLISLGVAGLGTFISSHPLLMQFATWGGALFLGLYGLRAFVSAMRPGSLATEGAVVENRRNAVLAALAFTLLNPYVYLDTVVLMGSVSSRYADALPTYWLGCVAAALLWFSSLGFFAGKLAPLFARPVSWRVLDSVVGLVLCATAVHLVTAFG